MILVSFEQVLRVELVFEFVKVEGLASMVVKLEGLLFESSLVAMSSIEQGSVSIHSLAFSFILTLSSTLQCHHLQIHLNLLVQGKHFCLRSSLLPKYAMRLHHLLLLHHFLLPFASCQVHHQQNLHLVPNTQ